jgi:porphobilinogen synthase
VIGEYSMDKAASQNGCIDEKRVVLETLTAFKRAGAYLLLTFTPSTPSAAGLRA